MASNKARLFGTPKYPVAVKRAMLVAARRRVLLADHTKVGSDHFARFGSLEDLDVLVSDTGLEPDAAAQLGAAGPRVVLA